MIERILQTPDSYIIENLNSAQITYTTPNANFSGQGGIVLSQVLSELNNEIETEEALEFTIGLYDLAILLRDKEELFEATREYMERLSEDCSVIISDLILKIGSYLVEDVFYESETSVLKTKLTWFTKLMNDLSEKKILMFPYSLSSFNNAVMYNARQNFVRNPELSRAAYSYLLKVDRSMLKVFVDYLDMNETQEYESSSREWAIHYLHQVSNDYRILQASYIAIPDFDGMFTDTESFMIVTERRRNELKYWAERLEKHNFSIKID